MTYVIRLRYLPTSRGFSSHYGTWNAGGDHSTHITTADPRSTYTTFGYDFHRDEDSYLGAIGSYTSDLLVDRFSDLLAEHYRVEQGWFSGYPTGKVKLDSVAEVPPLFMYLAFENVKLPLKVDEKFEAMYPYQEDPVRRTYLGMISSLDDAVGRVVNHLKRFSYDKATDTNIEEFLCRSVGF